MSKLRRPRIDILVTPDAKRPGGMLGRAAEFWRQWDIDIHVRPIGEPDSEQADLAIAHVDRTFVDPALLRFERERAPVLNGLVSDISKRSFSKLIIERGAGYEGPVIVKTDLNNRGKPEMRRSFRGFIRRAALDLPAFLAGDAIGKEYPVFDSPADVPERFWSDRRYTVERFVREPLDGLYVLRYWHFFGDRDLVTCLRSRNRIVKNANSVDFECLDGPPDELKQVRKDLGFDFGKFDYIEIEGKPILLDINKTPGGGLERIRGSAAVAHLAKGIHDYLEDAGRS